MRKLFIIFAVLFSFNVLAAPPTIDLGMTLPTTNTDSSALDNMSHVQVWCSVVSGGPYVAYETETNVPPAPLIDTTITITATNCMVTTYGSVYFVVVATNNIGMSSSYSNEVSRTFADDRIPNAPVLWIVN